MFQLDERWFSTELILTICFESKRFPIEILLTLYNILIRPIAFFARYDYRANISISSFAKSMIINSKTRKEVIFSFTEKDFVKSHFSNFIANNVAFTKFLSKERESRLS